MGRKNVRNTTISQQMDTHQAKLMILDLQTLHIKVKVYNSLKKYTTNFCDFGLEHQKVKSNI